MEDNELIKEFVDRCRSASRTLQTFIHASNPPPDEDTLQTLIETNDEVSVALSQQQRAMLKARKARGSAPASGVNSPSPAASATAVAPGASLPVPAAPARDHSRTPEQSSPSPVELAATEMSGVPPAAPSRDTSRYEYNSADYRVQNPFADDYATHHDSDAHQQSDQGDAHETDRVRLQAREE